MPIILDLFCGAGGAAEGYRRAGFTVIGVDNVDHVDSFSHIGEFHQLDWREGLRRFAKCADYIHASPPCQRYSQLTKWGRKENVCKHVDLIGAVRRALAKIGKPYIIENVERAPLINPIKLCAWTFGREHYRHRLFETNFAIEEPPHRQHNLRASSPGHFELGTFISVGGHFAPAALAREVMDIDWMSGSALAQAIPPYYTEYIGLKIKGRKTEHLFNRRKPGPQAKKLIWSCGQRGKRMRRPPTR